MTKWDRAGVEAAMKAGKSLKGEDLGGLDFNEASLRGADLRGCRLDGARFIRADLTGAALDGASVEGAWFELAVLQQASLRDVKGGSGHFANCFLQRARLDNAVLPGVGLQRRDDGRRGAAPRRAGRRGVRNGGSLRRRSDRHERRAVGLPLHDLHGRAADQDARHGARTSPTRTSPTPSSSRSRRAGPSSTPRSSIRPRSPGAISRKPTSAARASRRATWPTRS